jgi:broad specificity phosphatase PhoE
MHVVFIRHGESTGNIGIPCPDVSGVELTELGRQQARQLAESWVDAPELIVVSPFLRTRQTAQPTCDRFPTVPVREWAIEEFTYLEPSRWNGTTYSERLLSIEAYWKSTDPEYRDGPGAESFATLLRRADAALERLRAFTGQVNRVFLFSHGQFTQAVRVTVAHPEATDQEKMRRFVKPGMHPAFQNVGLLELEL